MPDVRTKQERKIDRRIKANVLRGIELLKKQYGPDFADHIDMKALRLSSGAYCVLGQLYGGWMGGCEKLGIDHLDGQYGFSTRGVEPHIIAEYEGAGGSSDPFFDQLQWAWEEELALLREP